MTELINLLRIWHFCYLINSFIPTLGSHFGGYPFFMSGTTRRRGPGDPSPSRKEKIKGKRKSKRVAVLLTSDILS